MRSRPVLADMAIGETLAMDRGHDGPAEDRQAHLPAMRMAGERHHETVRHVDEKVRFVRHEDRRGVIADLGERRRQVVRASVAALAGSPPANMLSVPASQNGAGPPIFTARFW